MAKSANLLQKFQELHIETGHLTNNEVEAWFDLVDEPTRDFLKWFQTHITVENKLTYSELMASKDVSNLPFLASDDETLTKIGKEFDKHKLEKEIKLIEDELEYNKLQCNEVDKSIKILKRKKKVMQKNKSLKNHQTLSENFSLNEHSSVCHSNAELLEGINNSISKELEKCQDIFELGSLTEFLHEVDYLPHVEFTKDCNSLVKSTLQKTLDQMEKTLDQQQNNLSMVFVGNTNYELQCKQIENNLMQAIMKKSQMEINTEVVKASIDYLQDVTSFKQDLNDVSSIDMDSKKLEEVVRARVEMFTQIPALFYNSKAHELTNLKIDFYQIVEEIMNKLLVDQAFLKKLIGTEIDLFKEYELFSKSIHDYFKSTICPCESRIEIMNDNIKSDNAIQAKSLEDKWTPLIILSHLNNVSTNISLNNTLSAVQNFHSNYQMLHSKVFIESFDALQNTIKEIELGNQNLQEFLTGYGTQQICIIPSPAHQTLKDAHTVMADQKKVLTHLSTLLRDSKEQIDGNKWLKYKRQLWMHFLVSPNKVDAIINKLKGEVDLQCKKFFS